MRLSVGQVFLTLFLCLLCLVEKGLAESADTPAVKATIEKLNRDALKTYISNPDAARKMAENALLLSERVKYNAGAGHSFVNLGHVYWSQSYYPVSLFYFNSALTRIPTERRSLLAECYNGMGRTYLELKDYNAAINCLNTAARYSGKDVKTHAEMTSEMSLVYIRMKRYQQAEVEALKSLKLSRSIHDDVTINILYTRLSSVRRLQNDFRGSIAYDDTAINMSFKTGNRRLRAKTYIEYAYNYNGLKDFDKAIAYAQRGAELADSIGLMDGQIDAYKTLMYSFEQKHDLARVLIFQKKYNAALDSLNTADKRRNTQLIRNYFALNAKLNQIAVMAQNDREARAKINFQNTIIMVLAVFLIILFLALYVTYYNYKHKKQLNNTLKRQHEALVIQKNLIEEQSANVAVVNKLKDKLLAVIGHDLRTPVANLRNFTKMFNDGVLSADEVNDLMKRMDPVIRGAELTLSNLLEWAGSQIRGISVTPSVIDINAIGDEMAQTYNYQLRQKNIRFEHKAVSGHLIRADEKHVKVILGNLISNAIKFTNDDGTITLRSCISANDVIISIKDTGKGIASDRLLKLFDLNQHFTQNGTMGETGTGIGLFLCKELVEFNGGKLSVESQPGKGSTFSFSLPLADKKE